VNDIKTHGLREPITLDPHGLLLDGRNRLAACEKAGVTPRFRIFDGHPLTFVVSENLQRRHLDTGGRAMVAARIADMRQGERTDLPSAKLQKVSRVSRAQAAEMLHVSERSVADAQKVMTSGVPKLAHAVVVGELPVSTAAAVARQSPEAQRDVLAAPDPAKAVARTVRGRLLNAPEKITVRRALLRDAAAEDPGDDIADYAVIAAKLDLGECEWQRPYDDSDDNDDSDDSDDSDEEG
jgi:hypothetical protein